MSDDPLAHWKEAQALRAQGRHADALLAYARALAAADDPLLEARIQIGRIDSLGVLGHEDEAIALGALIEAQLEAGGRSEDAARARMNIANLHYRRDRHAEALADFERAAAVFARSGDPTLAARADANAANALSCLGRLEGADERLERARSVFADAGQTLLAAMCEANRGYLHFLSGRHGRALESLSRALEVFEESPDLALEVAKCRADRADVYSALNLLPEARADYEAAIPVLRSVGLRYETARAHLGLASIHLAAGRRDEARVALDDAEEEFTAQGNRLHLGRVALLRAVADDPEQARLAERRFVAARQFGWAGEARLLLADGSLPRLRAVVRTARAWSRGWLECRARRAIGRIHRERGDLPRAIAALRAAVEALEAIRTQLGAPEELHATFVGDKVEVYEELIDALLTRGRPRDRTEALSVLERSRSRLLRERLAQAGGAPPDSDRLEALRRELSQIYHRLNGLPDETRRFGAAPDRQLVAERERAYRAALREHDLRRPRSAPAAPLEVSPRALAAALSPDEAMLLYRCGPATVDAFVLRRGRPLQLLHPLCERGAVEQAARRLRFHLQRPRDSALPQVESVLAELYGLLIQPLEGALAGARRLIVVPHGPLHGLPFHALHDGCAPALDRWEWLYAPSAALWQLGRRSAEPGGDALVMAVPAPGIPAVGEEAATVARRLGTDALFCGAAARRETFLERAPDCRWLHLATHAAFRADNPLFSGLQLGDAWLLARDLYDLTLPHGPLVTLSACQTAVAAVAPGDETFGLVRAFLEAGARSVLASLWSADDAATRMLMEKFYESVTHTPHGPAEALRRAQQAVRQQRPHPYYWAAFTLAGQP